MQSRYILLPLSTIVGVVFSVAVVSAWTGPGASPPSSNVSAPINVGSTAQIKSGTVGFSGLAVFGNSILQADSYLNWGTTSGTTGYGIRDNAGTLEFKNTGGTWASLQSTISSLVGSGQWTTSGNNIYSSNTGNVGIGTAVPDNKLEVNGAIEVEVDNADSKIRFNDTGDTVYSMGIDVSDGGKFKINLGNNIGDAAHFSMTKTGDVYAPSFMYMSDRRLKNIIGPIENALEKLSMISGVLFTWKVGDRAGEKDVGVIAQDVEAVLPEAVRTDANGMKAVDYPRLIPLLVNAIREQQMQITDLQAQVAALQAR